MKRIIIILITCICILCHASGQVNAQKLKVYESSKDVIYEDLIYKSFFKEDSVYQVDFIPLFKPITDTIKLKQFHNHVAQQILTDDIKRILKEEKTQKGNDFLQISFYYNKQGKIISACIRVGKNLLQKITDRKIRELYTALLHATIDSQFLKEATLIDEWQPSTALGMDMMYLLVPNEFSHTVRWFIVNID